MSNRKFKRRFRRNRRLSSKVAKNTSKIKLLSKAIEYKHHDVLINADGVDTTGECQVLNTPQVGNTSILRIGNKVLGRRLTLRGYLSNNNGTPTDCIVRMIVFRARDQNNVAQTLALLLESGVDVNSFVSDTNKHRFQILADKTFVMDTTQHSYRTFYFTHKCKSVTQFSADTGAATDIEDGAYYIAYFSTVAAGANAPTLVMRSRYYFMDA